MKRGLSFVGGWAASWVILIVGVGATLSAFASMSTPSDATPRFATFASVAAMACVALASFASAYVLAKRAQHPLRVFACVGAVITPLPWVGSMITLTNVYPTVVAGFMSCLVLIGCAASLTGGWLLRTTQTRLGG